MNQLLYTYNLAYKFLEKKVGKETLNEELSYYSNCKPENLNAIFKRMLVSLKNKQGYVNFVAPIEEMEEILLDYDCHRVLKEYDANYEKLFLLFKAKFPKYKFDLNNKRNAWVMYSKGVLSCAKFLSTFADSEQFDKFVKSFYFNEYTIAALPMLLEKELYGYGFALACDFLKEIGYKEFGKPDIHLMEIFVGLNLVDGNSDYEIFKTVVKMAHDAKVAPVIVDKVFWMIGSGKLSISGKTIPRARNEFISYAKNINGRRNNFCGDMTR